MLIYKTTFLLYSKNYVARITGLHSKKTQQQNSHTLISMEILCIFIPENLYWVLVGRNQNTGAPFQSYVAGSFVLSM